MTGLAGMHRRSFLRTAGAAGLVAVSNSSWAAPASDASAVVAGKDKRLIIHGAEIPVLETPPELLTQRITPVEQLFVRNNQPLAGIATLAGVPLQGWKIEITGLVNRSVTFDAGRLADMDQVEHEMVLQCCGNGRALFARTVKAKGTQWLRGGMGNVRFRGVPLAAVLRRLNVEVASGASFVAAEGKDVALPGKEDFEHSLPVEDALNGAFLAVSMNGQPLPAVHGGPVRLVTPGFYGTMHMKWLSKLRFEAAESDNYNHIPRYRTPRQPIKPGTKLDYTFANSKACWRMRVKSLVLDPLPGSELKANQKQTLRGVAFNDGQARIDRVLVSLDRGETWQRARLEQPASPYGWYPWQVDLKLKPGSHDVWSLAVDSWGRSQPLDGSVRWNASGYEWNGVEKVKLVAR